MRVDGSRRSNPGVPNDCRRGPCHPLDDPRDRCGFIVLLVEKPAMPQVTLEDETIERLDALRIDDESYDELIVELINIYEASELNLFHAG